MDGRRTVAVLLCLLLSSSVVALDYIGPPVAQLKYGEVSVGFNYCYSREDVEFAGKALGIPFSGTFEDVESNRYYGNISLGLADYLNVFVRLGAADADYHDGEFNGTEKPAWGYGIKATFFEQGPLTIGGVGQMGWLSTKGTDFDPLLGTTDTECDGYEIQIAAGPTLDMGGWFLYGGAVYYILDGNVDEEWEFELLGLTKISADIEEDSNFGGFIGAQLPIGDNFAIGVDSTIMSNGYAVGGSVVFKF